VANELPSQSYCIGLFQTGTSAAARLNFIGRADVYQMKGIVIVLVRVIALAGLRA
jgi:hypothetical protein